PAMATEWGESPTSTSPAELKVPSPLPSSTDTLPGPSEWMVTLATTRSALPSPFRSAVASAEGNNPTSNERKAAANWGSALVSEPGTRARSAPAVARATTRRRGFGGQRLRGDRGEGRQPT